MTAAMMDRFKVSSPGVRPRRPNSRCERKCDKRSAPVSHRAPRHFPPSVEAGLRACGIGAYRLPGSSRSQWQSLESDASARLGCWLIRPRHLPLRGQQRPWKDSNPGFRQGVSPFLNPRSESASAPLSRFTPARGTRRDTSNERVDCTTQVAGTPLAAASGIYIENESLHLDLTGFSKL